MLLYCVASFLKGTHMNNNGSKVSRVRMAKSDKEFKIFQEPVYTGFGKDNFVYDSVTQCEDGVSYNILNT